MMDVSLLRSKCKITPRHVTRPLIDPIYRRISHGVSSFNTPGPVMGRNLNA